MQDDGARYLLAWPPNRWARAGVAAIGMVLCTVAALHVFAVTFLLRPSGDESLDVGRIGVFGAFGLFLGFFGLRALLRAWSPPLYLLFTEDGLCRVGRPFLGKLWFKPLVLPWSEVKRVVVHRQKGRARQVAFHWDKDRTAAARCDPAIAEDAAALEFIERMAARHGFGVVPRDPVTLSGWGLLAVIASGLLLWAAWSAEPRAWLWGALGLCAVTCLVVGAASRRRHGLGGAALTVFCGWGLFLFVWCSGSLLLEKVHGGPAQHPAVVRAAALMREGGVPEGQSHSAAVSHLGHRGAALAPGVTPQKLGWGPDDQPYPDRIAVNLVDRAELVWVPGGSFPMGSDGDRAGRDERPVHPVWLSGFWVYKHEVTYAQFARFAAASGWRIRGECWDKDAARGDQRPVESVWWKDAVAYSHWAGVRLPSEAQWEYAARGPEGREYPWGNEWDGARLCWKGNKGEGWWLLWNVRTVKVGSFPAGRSWCGALDLAGNVAEYCGDWYGKRSYAETLTHDPRGPAQGLCRVVRGGSWWEGSRACRSSSRTWGGSGNYAYMGFRCVYAPHVGPAGQRGALR